LAATAAGRRLRRQRQLRANGGGVRVDDKGDGGGVAVVANGVAPAERA